MRKIITLVFVVLLLLSNVDVTHSKDTIKVLVDETRVASVDELAQKFLSLLLSRTPDWRYSFDNYDEDWGFGSAAKELRRLASIDIVKRGELDYSALRDYDVLVIASFEESYSTAETDAIKQFVDNGGGLLLLAHFESPNNSIARTFDVLFDPESAVIADNEAEKFTEDNHQFYITDIKDHPVTEDVDRIALNMGMPITSYESGEVLARTSTGSWADKVKGEGIGTREGGEDRGPFDILLTMEIGRGRAVFFGGAWSFFNWVVDEYGHQNLDLLENAVEWLGEPGGPHRQSKAMNEQAQQMLSEAVSLYGDHQFSEAKTKFEEAIGIFEESNEIYQDFEADRGIEKANDYIEKCKTGIKADETFGNALELFDNQEYERAIEEFEKAKVLYEEIKYTERAKECTTKMEAVSLFQKGEDALSGAPSTFSPAGYEEAKSIFEQSRSKWEEYNDSDQMSACDEKITLCSNEIARIKRNRMMVIVGVAVTVVVIGVAVVIIVVRTRKARVTEDVVVKALKNQYAKGKITKEEYEQLKSISEKKRKPESEDVVVKALKNQYAKGKITREEYEKLSSVLEKE